MYAQPGPSPRGELLHSIKRTLNDFHCYTHRSLYLYIYVEWTVINTDTHNWSRCREKEIAECSALVETSVSFSFSQSSGNILEAKAERLYEPGVGDYSKTMFSATAGQLCI